MKEYQRSLDLDPNGDYALGQLAAAYQKLGNSLAADAAYKKAISVRPKYWAVYNWLGVFLLHQSRFDEAAEMFKKVIELAPDNYRGYSNLGGAYVSEGRYGDAIEILKKSIALRPNLDAYSNLGTAYFSLRRFADAAESFHQATKINDRNFLAWGNLGDALYWTPGRRAEAKAAYDKALALGEAQEQLNPRDGETVAMMADYYAMNGQKSEAMDSLERALRLEPKNSEVLFRAALVYNHFGQTSEALQWLQKAIEAGYPRSEVRGSSRTLIRCSPMRNSGRSWRVNKVSAQREQ